MVGFVYTPVRGREDVSNRSVLFTYQLQRHGDVSAWSATSQSISDLNETSLQRRMPSGKKRMKKKLIEMSRNDDHTTGKLLDYLYHQKYNKLIDIDLSRQKNTSSSKQINIVRKLEEDSSATMFFIP